MESIREDTAVDIPLLRLLSIANIMYDKRVRKLLVLLSFYVFWAKRRLKRGSYEAEAHDGARCVDEINHILFDAG